MQSTISVRFGSVDEADRAIARLRRSLPDVRAERSGGHPGSTPAEAPYTASVYYPWRINMSLQESGTLTPSMGSRALSTSDLMGLPIYYNRGTTVLLRLDTAQVPHARALLVNLGGQDMRVF